MRRALIVLSALALSACAPSGGGGDDDDSASVVGTSVRIQTSMGSFDVALFEERAPVTAANFLAYTDSGFFDGGDAAGATIVHRVVSEFVIQAGGLTESLVQKDTLDPIVNEASLSGLSNVRGTLAMARTTAPDSATSQWFVNLVDNTGLDPGASTAAGYAVFAEVVDGMGVVDAIGAVAVADQGGYTDVPVTPILLESVTRL